jgi:hypothetical protein
MARKPRPPELGPAGLRLWREVTSAYELAPAEVETLRQLCHTADLCSWLQRQVESEPLTVPGSTGQMTAHPLLSALADQRRTMELLFRSLSLPFPDEVEGHRRSPQQIEAAQHRWKQQRRASG